MNVYGIEYIKRNDINKGRIIHVLVTLFSYPWNEKIEDENEVISCLEELAPEDLLMAKNAGNPVNMDVEVY